MARAADEVQGAAAILQKIAAQTQTAETEKPPDLAKLQGDLAEFGQKNGTLPPADAARGWLELVDRIGRLTVADLRATEAPLKFPQSARLLAALPAPAAWPELGKQIAARPLPVGAPFPWGKTMGREIGLRILAHTLVPDEAARTKDIAALDDWVAHNNNQQMFYISRVATELQEAQIAAFDDPDRVLARLEKELAAPAGGDETLQLPDLVTLLGREKAEKFLRRAFLKSPRALAVHEGEETAKLARAVALELVDKLKSPPWDLTLSLDATELYEALQKRFGEAAANDENNFTSSARAQARTYYMMGLIAKGRTAEAVAAVQTTASTPPNAALRRFSRHVSEESLAIPDAVIEAMDQAGYTKQLADFLHEILAKNPKLPLWDEYTQVAAKAGEADVALKLARATAQRADMADDTTFKTAFYKVLLAADEVDDAIKELRALLKNEKTGGTGSDDERGTLTLQMAQLGVLLERDDLAAEGIAAARAELATQFNSDLPVQLAWLLFKRGQPGAAEQVLADALVALKKAQHAAGDQDFSNDRARQLLSVLALIYHELGRHEDVLALLQNAPDWGAGDLADFFANEIDIPAIGTFFSHAPTADTNVGFLAASALAARSDKAGALKIANALLDRKGDFDPAFELLVQSEGAQAIPRLDELFARDKFEERPLIWKAELLLKAKKLDEAEKTIRQAIAIDPSDGEQGPGRRMRAYAVLADVLDARGDAAQAQTMRGAVTAIRLSEKADRFYEIGLLTRAVKMYEDALNHFADAYCIQSRLALRMAEIGDIKSAEEHYRRAYELMPSSFGRVESHCFGCEGVFAGQRAESIADKVFTKLVAQMPEKPQVHYLLGYLREEEERYADALPNFRAAVQLDPEYLNAWKHLATVGAHMRLPAAERDETTFNILRLDPLRRHDSTNYNQVTDLRKLWTEVAAADQKRPPQTDALLVLTASKTLLDAPEERSKSRAEIYRARLVQMREHESTPAEAVAENRFVALADELFGFEAVQSGVE